MSAEEVGHTVVGDYASGLRRPR